MFKIEMSIYFDWGSSYLVVNKQANKSFRCWLQVLLVFKLIFFIFLSKCCLKICNMLLFCNSINTYLFLFMVTKSTFNLVLQTKYTEKIIVFFIQNLEQTGHERCYVCAQSCSTSNLLIDKNPDVCIERIHVR
jgi:hypothetical protein